MTQTGKRRRIEAMVSGPAVLALFGWFVLSACEELTWPGGPPDLPTPGADAVYYDDIPVHESADGGVTFGNFHCDGQGKYLGGGDPASEGRTKKALEVAVESSKQELKDIDKDLGRCGGKKKFQYEYYAEHNCDTGELSSYREKARRIQKGISDGEEKIAGVMRDQQLQRQAIEHWQREAQDARRVIDHATRSDLEQPKNQYSPLGSPDPHGGAPSRLKAALTGLDRANEDAKAYRQERAAEEAKLVQLKTQLGDLRQQSAALEQRCNAAREAAVADSCSEANFNRLTARRSELREQAAMHQHRKDRFDKCVDDRKRRAQAPSVRPTVDPAVIQMLPGILNRPSTRPSKPAPSQPSHGH